jgi:glycosidase
MRLTLALLAVSLGYAQSPVVEKVEPPSWWQGSTWTPVRLLIRGVNLAGATLQAPKPLRVSRVSVNPSGTYLFADLDLSKVRQAGPVSLTVATAAGKAEAAFSVLPPLSRAGRFQGFNSDDFIYLVMPDRFANGDPRNDDPVISRGLFDKSRPRYYHGGDLQGVVDRLPYLKSLGVTALWLNPWYDNNNGLNEIERYDNKPVTDYHGYGAVDFYGVEEHFGTMETLKLLVEKAHASGIKIIQDQVANHAGPYHPWVKNPPLQDWFNGTRDAHLNEDWQTWALTDRYASAAARATVLNGWFVNILPDLNQENPEARRYVIQNALWWVGVTGLDGIRQDTLPYASRAFWAEWRAALAREFPNLNVVGEVLDGDPAQVAFFQGGVKRFDGIDSRIESLFDFPLFYALRGAFGRGQDLREVAKLLSHDWLYNDPSKLVTLAGLHDVDRFMNERGATPEGLKLAFSFIFTARGIPMVYYGDEIGMAGGNDPDSRRDFPSAAFDKDGRSSDQQGIWSHVQQLAALRRDNEALRRGETILLYQSARALVYARHTPGNVVITAFHNALGADSIDVDASPSGVKEGDSLRPALGTRASVIVKEGKLHLSLEGRQAAIWIKGAKE